PTGTRAGRPGPGFAYAWQGVGPMSVLLKCGPLLSGQVGADPGGPAGVLPAPDQPPGEPRRGRQDAQQEGALLGGGLSQERAEEEQPLVRRGRVREVLPELGPCGGCQMLLY